MGSAERPVYLSMRILSSTIISACLFLAGCSSWDWNSPSAYQAAQYGYYAGQQNNYNQQLRNQAFLAENQRMIERSNDNFQAQQRYNSLNRRLDTIQDSASAAAWNSRPRW
jgi:hypothetical protein